MSDKPKPCVEIEPDLIAAAVGEAPDDAAAGVAAHVARCRPCRADYERYRAIDGAVGRLRAVPAAAAEAARSRVALGERLADLRRRLLVYRIFSSPLGHLLIARSELGVSLVEYLDRPDVRVSRLSRLPGVEATEDGAEVEALYRELLDYLDGRRTALGWPLDLRFVRGDFDRSVLEATATLPYGAVTSYGAIARDIGKASAARAVAQALRWNPLPIVVPCHRVIGTGGDLTGYAGDKLQLKERLLAIEGVRTHRLEAHLRVARAAMYVRHRDYREYCLPTCSDLASRNLGELILFASRERAEAAGLTPCAACRPDVHPLGDAG